MQKKLQNTQKKKNNNYILLKYKVHYLIIDNLIN